MKIDDAVARHKRSSPSVKERVLTHIHQHPDEVFTYRDESLLGTVGTNQTGLNFALWSLSKDGSIDRQAVDGRVYFGTSQAVSRLKSRFSGDDWIKRGSDNRERIFKEHGYINTLELLDEVREGRWD